MSTETLQAHNENRTAGRLRLTMALPLVVLPGGVAYAWLIHLSSSLLVKPVLVAGLGIFVALTMRRALVTAGIQDSGRLSRFTAITTLVTLYVAWAFDEPARRGWTSASQVAWLPDQIVAHIFQFPPFATGDWPLVVLLTTAWLAEILAACGIAAWIVRSESRVRRFRPSGLAIELPLLRRELTELSNRRRTYVVRVVGACFLLFFVFIGYQQAILQRQQFLSNLSGYVGPTAYLGIGGTVFSRITPVLFVTIELLMPALCCAAITAEKENNTIGTLLLTRLSPGAIILEKVGSRVIPMLTILLLAFPVLAHVHSLGGVDTDLLIGSIWLLLSECFLIASIAIMCSAWFATTTAAFISSYVLIGILLVLSMVLNNRTFLPFSIWNDIFVLGNATVTMGPGGPVPAPGAAGMPGATTATVWVDVVRHSVSSWMAVAVFMLIARLILVRRAFVTPTSVLLRVFRHVDTFFRHLNERTTGGIEIVKDSNPLPQDDPVAWRERTKKSLGKARYLFRIFVALEVPTLAICTLAALSSARTAFGGLFILQCLIWILVSLIAAVKAASLFSSERARETIEPLLATPLLSRDLLRQKIVGVRRLLLVLAVPVLTVNLTHFMLHYNLGRVSELLTLLRALLLVGAGAWGVWMLIRLVRGPLAALGSPVTKGTLGLAAVAAATGLLYVLLVEESPAATAIRYLLISLATVFILLSLITWLATGVGMYIHSQTKAVLTSVGLLVTWSMLPIVMAESFWLTPVYREAFISISPYSLIEATERFYTGNMLFAQSWNYADDLGEYWWVATHLLMGTVTLVLRRLIIRSAPRLLNRMEQEPTGIVSAEPSPGGAGAVV